MLSAVHSENGIRSEFDVTGSEISRIRTHESRLSALLFAPTFCSAIHAHILDFHARVLASRLREGRDEEVTCAGRGRCSNRTVIVEARTDTGLHMIEARRRFLRSDLESWHEPYFVRAICR